MSNLDSQAEEDKSASSLSIGYIAVGNLSHYLPEILKQISSSSSRQYLLLASLREVIDLLFQHTSNEEDGTRNIVSECLGKLAMINPEQVIQRLVNSLEDENPETRACAVTAIKFSLSHHVREVESQLTGVLNKFLNLLDESILVRKSVLLTFNYICFQRPSLIKPHLINYLEKLYEETTIKPELIEEVEIGPFKHKVDRGLDLVFSINY